MSVIALAGRRIDAEGAQPPRFPSANVSLVCDRLRQELRGNSGTTLVSSAACGADLVALRVAAELGMRRRVVLPFEAGRFRDTSVSDRPGDWGDLFDQVVADLRAGNDLMVLDGDLPEADAYAAANRRILDEAQWLGVAGQAEVITMLVWDGEVRGDDDLTAAFGDEARRRGLRVLEISTGP